MTIHRAQRWRARRPRLSRIRSVLATVVATALAATTTVTAAVPAAAVPASAPALGTAAAGHLSLTGPLAVSPPTPTADQPTTISFAVTNDGGASISVPLFLAGVRDAANANRDFPASPAVTLQPGQSYGYQQSRTLVAGPYTAWPAYYDGTNWIELGAHTSFTVAGTCPAVGSFGGGAWPPACWRPYASTSAFNQPVPAAPAVRANSATIVAYLLNTIARVPYPNNVTVPLNGGSGWPTYWARPTDPVFTLHTTDFGGCPDVEGAAIRVPAGAEPQGGSDPTVNPLTNDRHLTVIDQATGWEYDLWRVQATSPLPAGGGTLAIGCGGRSRIDGSGVSATTTAGTGSGLSNLAGRSRAEEVQSGTINHALTVTVNCVSAQPAPPATRPDQLCSSLGLDNTQAPAMGAWLQLNMTTAEINASTVPRWERPWLQAMATYGMYINDTGAQGYFAVQTESGNQYTSLGSSDQWLTWANANSGQAGWSFYNPDQDWVGHWTGIDWTRLRVLCRPDDTGCPY